MPPFTPIFIPGLLCTEFLFAKQRANLANAGLICNTRQHDSINEMAQAALDQCRGALVPIGLSMGGYVALEMARLAPARIAGMGLLSTNAGVDNDERANARRQAIRLATHKGFKGITRSFLSKLISKTARDDGVLADNILAMARDIGRVGFVRQQTAILGRRDQKDTLANFNAPVLVLCGTLDVLTPPKLSIEMADLAPDATLKFLHGIGHLSSLEAPRAVTTALHDLFCRIE
ncbi:alpha/beta hydrolase [Candidatus Puniceispirillum sp.]|nr:alpha/beta hydrolase [Candidatus Puniceispirillum sp.]